MNPLMWINGKVKSRVADRARECRIENLEHNKKFAEQNGLYFFLKMLIADIEAEERARSPAQLARMAKKKATKVTHE